MGVAHKDFLRTELAGAHIEAIEQARAIMPS